jgi:hypothetical protein
MLLTRGLQVLGGLFLDLWPFGNGEPDLMIDMKRVNVELRKEGIVGLEDDMAYRNRVKQRVREGSGCTHPPLIDRTEALQCAAPPRGDARRVASIDAALWVKGGVTYQPGE